jgi:hypothetical protein
MSASFSFSYAGFPSDLGLYPAKVSSVSDGENRTVIHLVPDSDSTLETCALAAQVGV